MKYNLLHNFISPITGRVLANPEYVLMGDDNGIATPSPILIDIRLDLVNLRQDFDKLAEASFILNFPNTKVPNAQVLSKLGNGYLKNTAGILSIDAIIPITALPNLTIGKLWTGGTVEGVPNRPVEITILPLTNMANLTHNNVHIGDGDNRPVEVSVLPLSTSPALTAHACHIGDESNRPAENFAYVRGPSLPLTAGLPTPTIPGNIVTWSIGEPFITGGRDIKDSLVNISVIADMQAEISSIQSEISGIQEEIAAIQEEIVAIQEQLTAIESSIAAIEADVAAIDLSIAGIDLSIVAIEAELIAINLEIDGLIASVATIEGEIVAIQTQVSVLEGSVGTIQGQITTIFASIAALGLRIDNLRLNTISADADVSFHGYKAINLADPVNPQDGVTKNWAESLVSSASFKTACYAATTANLTATYSNGTAGVGATLTNSSTLAAFSVDGQTPALNSRILVKNQSSTLQNGIYTLTTAGSGAIAWVLTRANDYNQVAKIPVGNVTAITNGTVNTTTSWLETATVTTIGTSPIIFTQFSYAPQTLTANAVLVAGASNSIISQSLTNGQMLIGSNAAAPVAATPTNGTNISWIMGAGSLTANLSGQVAVANGGTGLASTVINRILYSSANNVIGQISSVNSAVLVTNSSGVPSFSASNSSTFLRGDATFTNTLGGTPTFQPTIATALNLYGTIQAQSRIAITGSEYYQSGNTSPDGMGIYIGVNRPGNRQLWITDTSFVANTTNAAFRVSCNNGSTYVGSVSTSGDTVLPLRLEGSTVILGSTRYPTTVTTNRLLYASDTNSIGDLSTLANGILATNGSGIPAIVTTLPFTVPVTTGGTGLTTATAYGVICGGTSGTASFQSVGTGSTGKVLTSTGTSSLPSWQTPTTGTLTSITAGTGLTGGTIITTGTIALDNTTVSAGSYVFASITVDAQGRLTAASNGSAAPPTSKYIIQTADAGLANAQVLASLSTGLLKNTTTTGVLTVANVGVDYYSPDNPLKIIANANNIFVGKYSGNLTLTSVGNCGFGNNNLTALIDAYASHAFGFSALAALRSGNGDNAFGLQSFCQITIGSSYNSGFGHLTGNDQLEYNKCSFFGAYSDALADNITNSGAFGYRARVGIDNAIVLGDNTVNVGIGTSYPSNAGLVVSKYVQNVSGEGTCIRASSNLSITKIEIENTAGTNKLWEIRVLSNGNLDITDRTGLITPITFNPATGRVGIGTPSPDQLLTVNTANVSKVGAGGWVAFSDKRIKTFETLYTRGLAEIITIEPKIFRYNELSGYPKSELERLNIGIFAQDIEDAFPECITRYDRGDISDMRSYDMTPLTYAIINSIKELNERLINLENQLIN